MRKILLMSALLTTLLPFAGFTEDTVYVQVNGDGITRSDFERERHLFSHIYSDKDIVESLIDRKVIVQTAEEKLNDQARVELEREVNAYRESRLLRAYLKQFVGIQSLQEEEIRAYYDKNQHEFGGVSTTYDVVVATFGHNANEEAKETLYTLMGEIQNSQDWNVSSEILLGRYEYAIQTNFSSIEVLGYEISAEARRLTNNGGSAVFLYEDELYLVRAIHSKSTPLDFDKVKSKIRRGMNADSIRKAIENTATELRIGASIEYVDCPQNICE